MGDNDFEIHWHNHDLKRSRAVGFHGESSNAPSTGRETQMERNWLQKKSQEAPNCCCLLSVVSNTFLTLRQSLFKGRSFYFLEFSVSESLGLHIPYNLVLVCSDFLPLLSEKL